MDFVKMHGAGNDFIIVNNIEEKIPDEKLGEDVYKRQVSTHHPFPHLVNKGLYTAVLLQINDTEAFGIIPVPQSIGRVIRLPGSEMKYVLTENIVTEYADRIFDNCKVTARSTVSITRNADINVSSLADEDEDFRHHMKKLLKKRSRLAPVRMEYYREIDQRLEAYLAAVSYTHLDVYKRQDAQLSQRRGRKPSFGSGPAG